MYATESDYEVIIVGGGVSGLSAALLLARSCVRVCLISDASKNMYKGKTHNFLTNDGETKEAIEAKGRLEIENYSGATMLEGTVSNVTRGTLEYGIELSSNKFLTAKKVIFAMGFRYPYDSTGIEGFDARFGLDVFTCPYCHGYELINRRIILIGTSDNDVPFARILSNWFNDVVYITHKGMSREEFESGVSGVQGLSIAAGVASEISGKIGSPLVALSDGADIKGDSIFLADLDGSASSWPLIDSLGIERGLHPLTGKAIYKTDAVGRTDLGNVFIIGDARTGFSTLAGAAHEGMIAGYMVTNDIIDERKNGVSPRSVLC